MIITKRLSEKSIFRGNLFTANLNHEIHNSTMNITCNGEQKAVDNDISLNDLVLSLKLNPQSLVAEVNGKIIEQPQFSDKKLQDGDRIELIRFVGGG